MLRFFSRTLSPAGKHVRLSVFIFHRVLPQLDPLLPFEPSSEQFDWMVRFISKTYTVMSLKNAAIALESGTLPAAPAVLTFDDGYADNFEVAWPILQHYKVPATFFIATSFLDGGRMWNDEIIEAVRRAPNGEFDLSEFGLGTFMLEDIASRVACYETLLGRLKYVEHHLRSDIAIEIAKQCAEPERRELMMTGDQLRKLRGYGAEIGGHTHTHPILERLDDKTAFAEMEAGKLELESRLGEAISVFAYPNGVPMRDCSARHGEMARKLGFLAAVTTEPLCASIESNLFHLPRFTPWDRTPLRFAARSLMHLRKNRD